MSEIMTGAEPWRANGGPVGVLALHGFTGSPQSMRPVAEAMAAAGHAVELPLLPGHGTVVTDMIPTNWSDWTRAVEDAYRQLADRTEQVVVTGLSMGGSLSLWLAARHPELAGVAVINAAAIADLDLVEGLQTFVDGGAETIDSIGGDIARDGVVEVAYDEAPLRPLISLHRGLAALGPELAQVTMPTLIITSRNDHVVDPKASDLIARRIGTEAEHLLLDDSFHVATLDNDGPRIVQAIEAFVARVTESPSSEV